MADKPTVETLQKEIEDLKADRDKWKDLSQKHEKRSKDNYDELETLKKQHASSQTDADKVAEKIAELEKRTNEADARALRAEVASAKKLTPAQAKRLQGATREELESDADELLADFKTSTATEGDEDADSRNRNGATRPATKRPQEQQLSGGTDPSDDGAVEMDPAKLADGLPRH